MDPVTQSELDTLQCSLSDDGLVFLDGFHSVKHAVRFGADMLLVASANSAKLDTLLDAVEPMVAKAISESVKSIKWREIEALGRSRPHWTGVWGVARRPTYVPADAFEVSAPLILLENPQNLGNVGACIRVAAATGSGGVLLLGDVDLWSAPVIRAAAGLHFALPVIRIPDLTAIGRPIIAIDPQGEEIGLAKIPENPIFAFGNERSGISEKILSLSSLKVRLPMREGVSSLNLAVAVGAVLYGTQKAC